MMQTPIAYRDGLLVTAAGANYRDIRYGISLTVTSDGTAFPILVLDQDQVRELAAALTWIISEVDRKNGRQSFAASPRQRIVQQPPAEPPAAQEMNHDQ